MLERHLISALQWFWSSAVALSCCRVRCLAFVPLLAAAAPDAVDTHHSSIFSPPALVKCARTAAADWCIFGIRIDIFGTINVDKVHEYGLAAVHIALLVAGFVQWFSRVVLLID